MSIQDKYDMRLQEMLMELAAPDPRRVAKFIDKHCYRWLSETRGGLSVVYRGVKSSTYLASPGIAKAVFIKRIRSNRLPADTPATWTKTMDMAIHSVGGVADRTNSAFVSGHEDEAATYGKPYVFIPIGPFHYTWSREWIDWWGTLISGDRWENLFKPEFVESHPDVDAYSIDLPDKEIKAGLLPPHELNSFITADSNLYGAIISGHEIMISARAGLYINPQFYAKIYPEL